jgi:hypothetical protein
VRGLATADLSPPTAWEDLQQASGSLPTTWEVLVESRVWVNEAHPAYRRAVASRSEGYHLALAVALALAPLAVERKKRRR